MPTKTSAMTAVVWRNEGVRVRRQSEGQRRESESERERENVVSTTGCAARSLAGFIPAVRDVIRLCSQYRGGGRRGMETKRSRVSVATMQMKYL